eukprot:7146980-Pyramimonas_sp.AAC.1
MTPAIFAGIKSTKRRAKKASARRPLEMALMQRDFSLDWQLSLTHLAATPFAFTTGPDQVSQFPAKRLRTAAGHHPLAATAGRLCLQLQSRLRRRSRRARPAALATATRRQPLPPS